MINNIKYRLLTVTTHSKKKYMQ